MKKDTNIYTFYRLKQINYITDIILQDLWLPFRLLSLPIYYKKNCISGRKSKEKACFQNIFLVSSALKQCVQSLIASAGFHASTEFLMTVCSVEGT